MGYRQQLKFEAVHLGALLEQRDRLLAEGAVVIDQCDLLALQFVEATRFLGDVLDGDVGADPVGAEQREVPAEHRAVLRIAAAVTGSHQRDLVDRCLIGQGEGHAGGQGLKQGGPAVLALQALVAFDAAVGGITEFTLLERELDAVDAAAGVDQLEVIDVAVGPRVAVGGIGAGAIDDDREELLLRLGEGSGVTSPRR